MEKNKRILSLAEFSGPHRALRDAMKDELIIVLVARLGGSVAIPVEEIDATHDRNLVMSLFDREFRFEVVKK